jgi:hypothetical protein
MIAKVLSSVIGQRVSLDDLADREILQWRQGKVRRATEGYDGVEVWKERLPLVIKVAFRTVMDQIQHTSPLIYDKQPGA